MREKGEKDKMKQWLKYMAVACGFFVMAVVCFPTNGNLVSAEGTVSGNTAQTENESIMPPAEEGDNSWILTVKYNIDAETTEEIKVVSSGDVFAFSTAKAPEKKGYIFDGWLCSIALSENGTDSMKWNNTILKEEIDCECRSNDYNGATITLTAQWKDCYQNEVKIIYADEDGMALDGYGQSIKQQENGGEYETSFTVTVTSKVPSKDGNTFLGWKDADGKTYTAGNTVTYKWADYSSGDRDITFTASWKQEITPDEGENKEDDTESGFLEEGATPTNGENKLKANTKYVLGSGTWTVEGDPTIYEGGSKFYVEVEETYFFKQSQ